jgi:hypothetical protein
MVTTDKSNNGSEAPVQAEDGDNFDFSPAVKRAWNGIELGQRKTYLEQLREGRQDSLVKSMSNVRTCRTMLELKENELEDRGVAVSTIERQAREAGVVRARLELENALQECDVLAEELETLVEAIGELEKAGERPMLGGSRATRRRNGGR